MRRRWMPYLAGTALIAALVGTAPAQAQTKPADQVFGGFAHGQVVHVDALAKNIVVDTAWAGASVASKGLSTIPLFNAAAAGTIKNEMTQVVQPTLPNTAVNPKLVGNKSYARGSGLEVVPVATVGGKVQVSTSGPASSTDQKELTAQDVGGVAQASVLRAIGQANWDDNSCILGKPISEGIGYAADVQAITSGTKNPDGSYPNAVVATDIGSPPTERVDQTTSREVLVPQTKSDLKTIIGSKFGLMSETRQIIAPVTVLKGTQDIKIEVLGEWVMQVVAGGIPGSSFVQYGPRPGTSPETPVVRITQGSGSPTQVLLQQLTTAAGLQIPIPGVGEIVIGEAPRLLGGPFGSKPVVTDTTVTAAADVVRVKITAGDLADIRVGHMEATSFVPAGGISCEIPVKKDADPREVLAGQSFKYTIVAENPFDCELRNVKVVDNITVDSGIKYSVVDPVTPGGGVKRADGITWNDIGTIAPKKSATLTFTVNIAGDSAAGLMHNTAIVTGNCAFGQATGLANVLVPLSGNVKIDLPRVNAPELPQTGTDEGRLAIFAGILLMGAIGLRRPLLRAAALRRNR